MALRRTIFKGKILESCYVYSESFFFFSFFFFHNSSSLSLNDLGFNLSFLCSTRDQEVALAALRRESKIRRIRFSQLEKTRDEKRAEATRLGLEGSAFKRAGDTKGARRAYKQKLDVRLIN